MAHTKRDLRERRVIEDMLNAKMSVRKIAAEIGNCPLAETKHTTSRLEHVQKLPTINTVWQAAVRKLRIHSDTPNAKVEAKTLMQ